MTSKFLSRNGEIYRVLLENTDTFWLISFDNPMERPFCVTASELGSFYRVPALKDFSPKEQDLSSAAQQRLALIQPLLDRNMEAITDRQLRLSIAKDIAKQQNTTPAGSCDYITDTWQLGRWRFQKIGRLMSTEPTNGPSRRSISQQNGSR